MTDLSVIHGALTHFRPHLPLDLVEWVVMSDFKAISHTTSSVVVAGGMESHDEAQTLADQLNAEYPDGYPIELKITGTETNQCDS